MRMTHFDLPVYAHDITNLPSQNSGCEVYLDIKKSSGRISLKKEEQIMQQTRYGIRISDPESFGYGSLYEQNNKSRFGDDMVLSFNLVMKKVVFLNHKVLFSDSGYDGTTITVNDNTITTTPGNLSISLSTILSVHDNLSEEDLISIMSLLKILEQRKENKGMHNMVKSLEKFKEAMSSMQGSSVFEKLVNSLEIAALYDTEKEHEKWIDKVADIIGSVKIEKESMIKEWKDIFVRLKHHDENEKKIAEFLKGKKNIPSQIQPLREVVQEVIIDRLRKLNNRYQDDFGAGRMSEDKPRH